MFESALYFVLGFLCSALIALMISPAIWKRAVELTTNRIESSIPLSVNEIQAEKDQLRASFAMTARRLEHSIQELKDTASRQAIEINRTRDEKASLSEINAQKSKLTTELETKEAQLTAELDKHQEALSDLTSKLADTKASLRDKVLESSNLQAEFSQAQANTDSQRIELVAQQAEMDTISEKLASGVGVEKDAAKQIKTLLSEVKAARKKLSTAQNRAERLKTANETQNAKFTEKLKAAKSKNEASSEVNKNLSAEKVKTADLQSQLATANLRIEAMLENDPSQKAPHDKITQKDGENDLSDNVTLRNRINELAAQVTAMTAAYEGEDSPINKILEKAPKKAGKISSLADRIKALKETAR